MVLGSLRTWSRRWFCLYSSLICLRLTRKFSKSLTKALFSLAYKSKILLIMGLLHRCFSDTLLYFSINNRVSTKERMIYVNVTGGQNAKKHIIDILLFQLNRLTGVRYNLSSFRKCVSFLLCVEKQFLKMQWRLYMN